MDDIIKANTEDALKIIAEEEAKNDIYVDKQELDALLEKYRGGQNYIYKCIKYWGERFNKTPFEEKEKKVYIEEIKDWIIFKNPNYIPTIITFKDNFPKKPIKEEYQIFSRRGQIESFWNEQPFHYDKSKIFWLWDKENKKWILSDETDYLNKIQELLGSETIDSKTRTELVEGFKQIGRKHKPEDIKKSWVQFKDKIYDVETEEEFEASPNFFITNPLPWFIGKTEETPKIDKLFEEWVGKDYKQTLYEIIAYSISLDKFMQRIFAFVGGGANGKGTFIKMLYKFLGKENYVSSELKYISENRFEIANLYKKLLCVMGEVSYDDLKNTNQIKKLGGEDLMSFEFKGKNSFTAENTATCIILTNSLPTCPDKSIGFYRKWLIVDFPNEFKQINKDLIEEIPEVEFENLAKKSLRILKELYKNKTFTNEGDFNERAMRYEERSNPVMAFIQDCCEENEGQNITLREFTIKCNEYLKIKHLRILTAKQIGQILRNEGFTLGNRKFGENSAVVILNLDFDDEKLLKLSKLSNSYFITHKEMNRELSSFDSLDSLDNSQMKTLSDFSDEELKLTGFTREEYVKMLEKPEKKEELVEVDKISNKKEEKPEEPEDLDNFDEQQKEDFRSGNIVEID